MKALVLGNRGQLARALRLAAPEHHAVEVAGRDRLDLTRPERLPSLLDELDPDIVINAAAYTAVDRAEEEPGRAERINGEAPGAIARWCVGRGARLLHVSTDFVFDGRGGRPWRPDDEPRPLGVYGRTKRRGELEVLEAGSSSAVILRTAWVYSHLGTNFVLTMLDLMRNETGVDVVYDQVGAPTHAASLARALWRLADRPDIGGIHHWTDAGVASRYDFAVAVMEEAVREGLLEREVPVRPVRTEAFPTPATRPAFSVLDTTSTVEALGLAPLHWRKELRLMLERLS